MENCIICDSEFKKINDYIYKCKKCLFLKSILKPGYGRDIDGISELRKKNFRKIIRKIESLDKIKDLKILEIGSGNGFFIEECLRSNIDITGSEADEDQFKVLSRKYSNIINISLPLKDLNDRSHDKFDYIIFNDVFEHLENLDLVIKQFKNFLKNNGKVLINLPSSSGLVFKISQQLNQFGITNFYDRLWQKDLSSPHLSYFNNSNLEKLFKKHHYKLIYSSYLDTVNNTGNFKRLNSTIENKFLCIILSFLLFLFFYLQKILPKDIIYHIYKR